MQNKLKVELLLIHTQQNIDVYIRKWFFTVNLVKDNFCLYQSFWKGQQLKEVQLLGERIFKCASFLGFFSFMDKAATQTMKSTESQIIISKSHVLFANYQGCSCVWIISTVSFRWALTSFQQIKYYVLMISIKNIKEYDLWFYNKGFSEHKLRKKKSWLKYYVIRVWLE